MKYINYSKFIKGITVFLCLIIFQSGFEIQAFEGDHSKELSKLVKKYNNKKYDEIIIELEKLLNDIGEDEAMIRGKFFLLLGAAYENKKMNEKAAENYLLGDILLDKLEISGVDLRSLKVFNNTIYGVVVKGKRVFEKVGKRKKRKKFPVIAIIGVAALAATVFLLMKRKSKNPGVSQSEKFAKEIFNQIEWISIPAGEFKMGDNFGYGDRDELPVHTVYLDTYKISKYEVTFEQFDKYSKVESKIYPNDETWGRENRPVINISWEDANEFCIWLSQYTGESIHLPTEAQWEKAARGTDQRLYPWGYNEPDCDQINFNYCVGTTLAEGINMRDSSFYGVRNMGGNVAEFVRDGYQSDYYSISPYSDPDGPELDGIDYRVVRGGSWNSNDLRASNRSRLETFSSNEMTGFRIIWIDK